jgi:hypothetical protein
MGGEATGAVRKKGGTYDNAALQTPTLSMMSMKQKELSEKRPLLANSHAIENKWVIKSKRVRRKENAGENMKGCFAMLLKTHVEKMSGFGLSMILLKIKHLNRPFHDIYDNKGSY